MKSITILSLSLFEIAYLCLPLSLLFFPSSSLLLAFSSHFSVLLSSSTVSSLPPPPVSATLSLLSPLFYLISPPPLHLPPCFHRRTCILHLSFNLFILPLLPFFVFCFHLSFPFLPALFFAILLCPFPPSYINIFSPPPPLSCLSLLPFYPQILRVVLFCSPL